SVRAAREVPASTKRRRETSVFMEDSVGLNDRLALGGKGRGECTARAVSSGPRRPELSVAAPLPPGRRAHQWQMQPSLEGHVAGGPRRQQLRQVGAKRERTVELLGAGPVG